MAHSQPTMNQIRGAGRDRFFDLRRAVMQPALRDDLMMRVLDRANVQRAWKQVKANGGAAGVDGMTIEAFPAFARAQWSTIGQALQDGTYQPAPVRRHGIPKPDGGERMLGIPRILDRVIQQAIAQVLTPIFDPAFSESSFGFRPRRSAHGAVKQVHGYIKAGYRHCVDLDLAKFFDTVDHDVLMARVAETVSDKRLLQSDATCGPVSKSKARSNPQEKARRKAPRCLPCFPMSSWTCWIKNWSGGATVLRAMPTTQ